MKLINLETIRGRRLLLPAEVVEFWVRDDGFMQMEAPFGSCLEKLVPFHEAVMINAGYEPPEEDQ